jgi:hypothetical protein
MIRGRWGGIEILEKWVADSFTRHTAVCLKDEMGKGLANHGMIMERYTTYEVFYNLFFYITLLI